MLKVLFKAPSILVCGLICLSLVACVGKPPLSEFSLARSAVRAARDADAARFAPGYWHKAMNTYRQAQRYYKNKENELAKQYFDRARIYAERAENAAQLARATGDDAL